MLRYYCCCRSTIRAYHSINSTLAKMSRVTKGTLFWPTKLRAALRAAQGCKKGRSTDLFDENTDSGLDTTTVLNSITVLQSNVLLLAVSKHRNPAGHGLEHRRTCSAAFQEEPIKNQKSTSFHDTPNNTTVVHDEDQLRPAIGKSNSSTTTVCCTHFYRNRHHCTVGDSATGLLSTRAPYVSPKKRLRVCPAS